MSDTTNTDTPPTSDGNPDPGPKETDWEAEAKKWEKRSKDNFEKAKANEGAARRLAEIEEASKTELQKALDRAEAAEQRVHQFEMDRQLGVWRKEISDSTGVPADVLRGSSKEEMEAHAEELKPLLNSRRGLQVPTPGNIPSTPVPDESALLRQIFGER